MMNLSFTSWHFLLSTGDLSVSPNVKDAVNHGHLVVHWLQLSAAHVFWLGGFIKSVDTKS